MKINLFFATLALMASLTTVHAQKKKPAKETTRERVRVEWGEDFDGAKSETVKKVIGQDSKWIYVLKSEKGSKLSIDLVDLEMNAQENYPVEYNDVEDRDLQYEDVYMFADRLFLLANYRNKKEKTKHLVYSEIDKETFQLGALQEIAQMSYEDGSRKNSGEFEVLVSKDKSKIAVVGLLPKVKGEQESYIMHVYDDTFGELWSRQETLEYDQNLFDVADINLSNDGVIFVLGKLYNEKRRDKRDGEVNYKYFLNSYYGKADKESYEIAYKDLYLNDVFLVPQQNKKVLTMVGFYSEEGYGLKGTFTMDLNLVSREVELFNTAELGLDFFLENTTKMQAKRIEKRAEKGKSVELGQVELRGVFYSDSGNIVLAAERAYIEVITTRSGPTSYTTTIYHYDDIILIAIDKDRNIQWTRRIPKSQVTADDGGFYSSYFPEYHEGKLYLMYNDNKENFKVVRPGKPKAFNGKISSSMGVCAIVDLEDGSVTKTSLFSAKDEEVFARPKVFYRLDNGTIVVYAQRKKKHQYGKINLYSEKQDN
jgi:hypothetical protein